MTPKGRAVTFEEVLDQAIAMLERRGRLTYRTLQRQFQLDDAALDDLKGAKIAHKTNRIIRAYIQNSHLLSKYGFSYREFLRSIAGDVEFR